VDLVESILTWLLLFATAIGIGALVWLALTRFTERFSQNLAAPGVAGVIAGLGATWYLIDPIQFDTGREPVAFLLALLIGVAVMVAVIAVLRRALLPKSATLAAGLLVTAAVVGVAIGWASPTKLAGIAALVVLVTVCLAILASPGLDDRAREIIPIVGGTAAAVAMIDWLQAFDRMERILNSGEMDDIASTLWAVVLAVGGSCLLFVAANLVLNRSGKEWRMFSALAGGVIGFVLFGVLDGNRLLQIVGPREGTAERLHDWVNNGPWTLLVASTVIGAVVGLVFDKMAEVITEGGKKRRTGMIVFGVLGAVWGLLFGERIPVDTTVRVLWTALIGAAICAVLGYVISGIADNSKRALVSVGGGAIVGLVLGGLLKTLYQPRLETLPLIIAPVALAAVGAGLSTLRGRSPVTGGVTGALIGWLLGAFGLPTLGDGPEIEAFLATGVAGGLGGLRYGAKPYLDSVGRDRFEQKSRTLVFLGPALAFIMVGLVFPLVRTIYLSFGDEGTDEFVGLQNYRTVFTDPKSFNYTDRLDLFGSNLFWIGVLLVAAAVVGGMFKSTRTQTTVTWGRAVRLAVGPLLILAGLFEYVLGRQTINDEVTQGGNVLVILLLLGVGVAVLMVPIGQKIGEIFPSVPGVDLGGALSAIVAASVFFLTFALLTALRGTIINNLWWVFTVTLGATALGMAVAVLADKAKHENLAKSFIFMPLAISFVGAGIIWRFMYIARPPTKIQTGILNFFWVELGTFSTTAGTGRTVSIIILTVLLVALGVLFFQGVVAKASGVLFTSGLMGVLVVFFLYRFTIGSGIGGIQGVDADGNNVRQTILFLTDSQPFNNLWLMIVLIWIQTGFAMVIFSAAIKAVPAEFVEASRVDGATESQVFWKITLPTIAPTIGVVVTTLIVSVMKVFDIVKVMTNGNFDTQVVANEMWQRAFTELNFGLGSALAVVLFLAVVPVMYYNIRTMQKAG
jgi:ABC-type sugar transport system permease subunit